MRKILKEEILREALELYHGSIHSFDGFDMTKIGSGDGNDVHGYGFYFTDNYDVAMHYADMYRGTKDKFIYSVAVKSANFLQWDGYLDEQDAQLIYNKFCRINHNEDDQASMAEVLGLSEDYYGEHPWIQQLYNYLADTFGSKKGASEFLDRCGFDGISFKPKESGQDGMNYVIFSTNNLRLLDKQQV